VLWLRALRANIGSKSAILLQWRPVEPKFQVKGVASTNHSSSQKTRLNDLSYGVTTRNSSGNEIANVNFLYDDIVHVLQNTIDSCINSATDRRGYVSERMCLPNSLK